MRAPMADRVARNTPREVNEKIRRRTEANIWYYSQHPSQIPRRLEELDREWDIERCLETGSSSLSLLGLFLGGASHRKWLLLSLAVQGFFLQHAIQGWCPPLSLFRRLGVRTPREIEEERYALVAVQNAGAPESADAPGPSPLRDVST